MLWSTRSRSKRRSSIESATGWSSRSVSVIDRSRRAPLTPRRPGRSRSLMISERSRTPAMSCDSTMWARRWSPICEQPARSNTVRAGDSVGRPGTGKRMSSTNGRLVRCTITPGIWVRGPSRGATMWIGSSTSGVGSGACQTRPADTSAIAESGTDLTARNNYVFSPVNSGTSYSPGQTTMRKPC